MLSDGIYDVIVVDAEAVDAGDEVVRLELAVLAGPHKGEVLTLTGPAAGRDPLDLLGVPASLEITNGMPRLALEG